MAGQGGLLQRASELFCLTKQACRSGSSNIISTRIFPSGY